MNGKRKLMALLLTFCLLAHATALAGGAPSSQFGFKGWPYRQNNSCTAICPSATPPVTPAPTEVPTPEPTVTPAPTEVPTPEPTVTPVPVSACSWIPCYGTAPMRM